MSMPKLQIGELSEFNNQTLLNKKTNEDVREKSESEEEDEEEDESQKRRRIYMSMPKLQIGELSEFNDQTLLNKKADEDVGEKNESEEEVTEEIIIVKQEWNDDCSNSDSSWNEGERAYTR
ncbi:hypothetical protein LSTR_LSTR007897 [Laodelphax striatellus]|uniref:Uncharacterized protein n=1 Tax=Laodelphax striatellus TaxID=195883 RepID=A0A482WXK5_LAOST|nr:hypothetical protein LSTR_LSTR007897 [Laodelphax striatellus]